MKKKLAILVIVLIQIISVINCNAKGVTTYDRKDLRNYGVNKKWKVTEDNKEKIINTPAVDAKERLYDFADILTDEEEAKLKTRLNEFVLKTKVEFIIVIPSFMYTDIRENDDYATNFYNYNDFGIHTKNYDGILFLRNSYVYDPFYNVYSFGNAQLYISRNRIEQTLDDIFKMMREKKYYDALSKLIDNMTLYYKEGIPDEMRFYNVDENGNLHQDFSLLIIVVISIVVSFVVLGIVVFMYNKKKTKQEAKNFIKKEPEQIKAQKPIIKEKKVQPIKQKTVTKDNNVQKIEPKPIIKEESLIDEPIQKIEISEQPNDNVIIDEKNIDDLDNKNNPDELNLQPLNYYNEIDGNAALEERNEILEEIKQGKNNYFDENNVINNDISFSNVQEPKQDKQFTKNDLDNYNDQLGQKSIDEIIEDMFNE